MIYINIEYQCCISDIYISYFAYSDINKINYNLKFIILCLINNSLST